MYKYPDEEIYIGDSTPTICPKCEKLTLVDAGGCRDGCCDDFRCTACGYSFRMEWPD